MMKGPVKTAVSAEKVCVGLPRKRKISHTYIILHFSGPHRGL